mmetsp:Transcript_25949/g.31492  ORF Transcript_25949/g.31492 Transcript_25949/m.31492 type:complete len:512 (-) Transcript_25949:345-1880(-)|eukprot:CAMPEP_0197857772 /NCGR_PEP_ID=MMETSP1438-20131217/31135_1 /TAXON_ID=1461541 /ORGANISM="Pterosperma sp., Strain CCMP1384" /LENGTH=511 /DNA_ID=CAMNT_0043473725 /DNA_START=114 /DNA_END=1649 /DNA_ORIENTATION=+
MATAQSQTLLRVQSVTALSSQTSEQTTARVSPQVSRSDITARRAYVGGPARRSANVTLKNRSAIQRTHREVVAPQAALAEPAPSTSNMEQLRFLTPEIAESIRNAHGTPAYAYDLASLQKQAASALAFPNAFGLTVRYAMKSSPNAAILKVFHNMGLHIDASSGFEVRRAMAAGIPAENISLSSQELPEFFPELVQAGAKINACSLTQLERFGQAFPGAEVGVRFNPGVGSGGTGKTNVGGPSSSFGIWYELLPQVQEIVAKYDLKVVRIHTHIGSGSDPAVWQKVSGMSLDLCREFPDVVALNLGGGYKVGRMNYEQSTDVSVVGVPVQEAFEAFATETGRELKLEIEPGTFLLANCGSLVCTIQDVVTTGAEGHTFLKLDSGMTEVLRPSLYGSQHPIVILPTGREHDGSTTPYVVVGHCCESGDLMTPADGEPEVLAPRELTTTQVGDLCIVEGSGAYCSAMSTKNYNSFPEAPEVLVGTSGDIHLIRKRQPDTEIYHNEVPLPENLL